MRTAFTTLILVAAVSVPAQAADFCVGGPAGCAGTAYDGASLQTALNDASGTPSGPHRVIVAAGTYLGPFTIGAGQAIEVIGAGAGQTILTNNGAASGALNQNSNTAHAVRDVTLTSTGGGGRALNISSGSAQDVGIIAEAGSNSAVSIGGDAQIRSATITTAVSSAVQSGPGGAIIADTTITRTDPTFAGIGVAHSGTGAAPTLRRVRITGFRFGVRADSGVFRIEDSVIDLGLDPGGVAAAAWNANNSVSAISVEVVRTTIVGGHAGQTGLLSRGDGTGTENASLTSEDTVVALPAGATAFRCENLGAATSAAITLTALAHRPTATTVTGCTPSVTGSTVLDAIAPVFVDEAARDLRPLIGSPLVDSGTTTATASTTDLLGRARVVNGTVDRGAVEYQRTAPVIGAAGATPASIMLGGGAVAFSVAATDDDAEAITYAWDFGDGQAGSGDGPTHSYVAAGTFTATVTATDPAGLTDTAQVQVEVIGAPQATSAPVLGTDGSPAVGETVGATPAVWDRQGTFAREWLSCDAQGGSCTPIAGVTGTSLLLSSSVAGRTVRVRETMANAAGTGTSLSAPSAVVVQRPWVARRVRVIGVVRAGRVVRCGAGVFRGVPTPRVTYRWLRNGRPIAAATRQTYRLRPTDVGRPVSCRATARNAVGAAVSTSTRVRVRR